MGWIVTDMDGNTTHYSKDEEGWTEEQAIARAEKANADAEALGIKTRYQAAERS